MFRRTLIAALLLAAISPPEVTGGTIAYSGVEEALALSDVVVLGKVVVTPEGDLEHFGINDRPDHLFLVESYLVGNGPQYLTFGSRHGDISLGLPGAEGHSSYEQAIAKGFVSVETLMFLRQVGGGILGPSCGTHCAAWVDTDSKGERTVTLLFKDPRFMPPKTRKAYEDGLKRGAKKGDFGYLGVVWVGELQSLFDRMLHRQPTSPKPQQDQDAS